MKLYLIRHGQSLANLNQTHAGWGQVELTDLGKEQARHIGQFLRTVPFDQVYSSDLIRAIQTQECALPGVAAQRSPLIREVNVGTLSGRPVADCVAEYGQAYRDNKKNWNFSPYGGEDHQQFHARIREFLAQMEASSFENVAAFCHGGWIQHALDVITGKEQDKRFFPCDNCSVTILEYTNSGWMIKLWNFTGEL